MIKTMMVVSAAMLCPFFAQSQASRLLPDCAALEKRCFRDRYEAIVPCAAEPIRGGA